MGVMSKCVIKQDMRYIVALILILYITGCTEIVRLLPISDPLAAPEISSAPDGPPAFRKGWRDGCETGTSASANVFYKQAYYFKRDYSIVQKDPDYNTGWGSGFWYCSRYFEINHGFNAGSLQRIL